MSSIAPRFSIRLKSLFLTVLKFRGSQDAHPGNPGMIAWWLMARSVDGAGKTAAAVRYDALTAVYTMLRKQHVSAAQLDILLTQQAQLIPLVVQSMEEDWYVDTRRLACFVMSALLRLAGGRIGDETRRQIYPELNKRMDDSSNEVRIATAATIVAFAEEALPAAYCDVNSGYATSVLSFQRFCCLSGS